MYHDGECDALVFNSLPEYYVMEKSGAKANTLRSIHKPVYDRITRYNPEYIMIVNSSSGERFIREISSMIVIPDNIASPVADTNMLILISWWA